MDMFLLKALLAGIGVALMTGPLGCLVVWRRMVYFGDALSHSALLGIAIGILLNGSDHYGWDPLYSSFGIMLISMLFGLLLVTLEQQHILTTDSLLGILAHTSLSVGMVVISLLNIPNIDLHSFLFGDILTVGWHDIFWIYLGGLLIIMLLYRYWASFTLMTIHTDLARAEGINTKKLHILFMFLMTLTVTLSIHVVGILLVTSMLIIPAAAARHLARTPHGMAGLASLFGIMAVLFGLLLSYYKDTPSGPSIVVAASSLFVICLCIGLNKKS